MGWINICIRRLRIFTAALIIYLDYKALKIKQKWDAESKRDYIWDKVHERNAKRALNLIIELEGLWVKLGQYLSTRADVLPEPYIRLFRQLQDSLPPRPLNEVFRTIEKELGGSMEDLFFNFVNVPLATASIAQVHRATLRNGEEVVVKVQHEDIKAIMLEDLKSTKQLIYWVAWAEPQYNFGPMIDEWCKESPKELDFNHEAENMKRVSINLSCVKNNNNTISTSQKNASANNISVLIPEVIQSTEKVLILEYMDGIRLNDYASLEALGVSKQKIVEEITRAYAHQIFIDGFFNGDPHPGNFLVNKKPPHSPILLDFGLTKLLPGSTKLALAKMFLAASEGDYVALLSSFAEMGLKLRLDMPEQAMDVTNILFRTSTLKSEASYTLKSIGERKTKNMKVLQDRLKLSDREIKRFNPIDAFPGDIVVFSRVLNLLRGISSSMDVRLVFSDIMKPFAESVLQGYIHKQPAVNYKWVYDTPIHSEVEHKLRQFLIQLGNDNKILGIQVCAYKNGKVIIDTSAGVLGKYDPRPVQPDSLFPVFSVTKGITAGLLHWVIDQRKVKYEEKVADIWPSFGSNGKGEIKVHHVLNHTSGLHNAMAEVMKDQPSLLHDWQQALVCTAAAIPETQPGLHQLYHFLSFGWLCAGIIEHSTGKKFQDLLEEAFVGPLGIEGEMYIGIPPGVESRLASLTVDMDDISTMSSISGGITPNLPSTFQPKDIAKMAPVISAMLNMLETRRAVIPAANGHCSARALARYYATLVSGGSVPPPHSSASRPPLGSHPHMPQFSATANKRKNNRENGYQQLPTDDNVGVLSRRIFTNETIREAFMGTGEYAELAKGDGMFGLGFKRWRDGAHSGFGHSGMGGSVGYCDIDEQLSVAITVNKMGIGTMVRKIEQIIGGELGIRYSHDKWLAAEGVEPELIVIN